MIERLLRLIPPRLNPWAPATADTKLRLATFSRGSSNLEILKFGMYISFPIGWMYYFGTNLDNRFNVPDFWPAPGTTTKIPREKEEQLQILEVLKAERLERRRKRLEDEGRPGQNIVGGDLTGAQEARTQVEEGAVDGRKQDASKLGAIDKWATGKQ